MVSMKEAFKSWMDDVEIIMENCPIYNFAKPHPLA